MEGDDAGRTTRPSGAGAAASSAARPLKGERAAVDSCLRRGAMIAERARLTAVARIT